MHRREFQSLTGLRGIAAAWAMLFHFCDAPAGYLGVDIFFVLSGFVLAHTYPAAHRAWGEFLWRRLARIYPTHLATLLLTVVCITLAAQSDPSYEKDPRFQPQSLIPSLLLVHAWTIPVHKYWNEASWSVSAEWAAYICFPLVALVLNRLRRLGLAVAFVLLLFVCFGLVAAQHAYPGTMSYGIQRLAVEFLGGVVAYRFYVTHGGAPRLGVPALVLLIAGATFCDAYLGPTTAIAYFPVLACLVVYGLADAPVFTSPAMQYLGRISYGLYLIHAMVGLMLPYFRHTTQVPEVILSGVGFAVSLGLAMASHRWLETPAQRAMLQWWRKSPAAPSA